MKPKTSAHAASTWKNVELTGGGHSASVTSVEFGPDGNTVVSSSEDKKVIASAFMRAACCVPGACAMHGMIHWLDLI